MNKYLAKILKAEPGIKKVMLIDRTGSVIANVSKFSYYPMDVEGIGAIAVAVFCAIEEQGQKIELGGLYVLIHEYEGGKIFTTSFGENYVLSVITNDEVNIGNILFVLKDMKKNKY